MTAPAPKDGLPFGPPLNHEVATEEAQRYSDFSNLSRCYLDLIAQRDAAEARIDELESHLRAMEFYNSELGIRAVAAAARADRFASVAADMEKRALAAEAALSASRFSQKETGDHG